MRIFLTLDDEGFLLAFVIGILIILSAGKYFLLFTLELMLFLVLSAVVTNAGKAKKKGTGLYEISRGWQNVLANGLVPLLISLAYVANTYWNFLQPNILVVSYIASVAGITADKFASELGVLDGQPRMLLTMRKVKKGTSGGVTLPGTLASLIGSFVIALSFFVLGGGSFSNLIIITASGFLGGLFDSLLGYFEERGMGNKYTSNFGCSLAAAIVCALLLIY